MTEYQKTYIELKKQFVATNEGPDSVRALYTFKEELEQSEDQQAKEVLVDMYDLLDFKKDAYELLCQIGNRSDKKTLKRINALIRDVEREPYNGIGKPEGLKHGEAGLWSRHIDEMNRLVYRIRDGLLEIVSCRGHYDD